MIKKNRKTVQATLKISRSQKKQETKGAQGSASEPAVERTVDSLISRRELVDLVVMRLAGIGDIATRNTISQRIRRATEKRPLQVVGNDGYKVGEVGLFLRKTWPGKFDDFPAYNANLESKRGEKKRSVTRPNLTGIVLPENLMDAHTEIRRLNDLLAAADRKNAKLEREVNELRPDAQKYRERIVEKNKANARKKRSRS